MTYAHFNGLSGILYNLETCVNKVTRLDSRFGIKTEGGEDAGMNDDMVSHLKSSETIKSHGD